MKSNQVRWALFSLVILSLGALWWSGALHQLSLENFKAQESAWRTSQAENPIVFALSFAAIYIASTALSLPGATVLTLLAGYLFGLWGGTLLVSICSTIGATLAFWGSRYLFRDFVRERWGHRLNALDEGIEREGAWYLFALRLVPAFPFFIVNLAMGLTPIRTLTYVFVSQLGMLPATIAYVNAGRELNRVETLSGILQPNVLLSFAVIGLLPLVLRRMLAWFKSRQALRRFQRPREFDYNLIVIGAGSAGLVTSYIAAAVRAKVALIEKHKMGGDCLNTGCVPSKALIRAAHAAYEIREASRFGIHTSPPRIDFAQVMARVRHVIRDIEPHDSVERYTGLGVNCIQGEARLLSPWQVEVNGATLAAHRIVIATGARPRVPSIKGLSEVNYLTSDNVWNLEQQPKSLLVLGGGPIGCELAQAFHRLGTPVTLLERGDRLVPREDVEVSEILLKQFRREGIEVHLNTEAQAFISPNTLRARTLAGDIQIEFDRVLLALGRSANTRGFGLEELGVQLTHDGRVQTDATLRTNIPTIYACGDVAGPYQFTHTAAHQAWYASVNALFSPFKTFDADYRVIPWATFTHPEIARVGLNEIEAREQQVPCEVTTYSLDDLDRAIADGEAAGFIKVLTRPGSDKILGVTIVGAKAGDWITEYIAAMKANRGLNDVLRTIHIYPTMAEANKFVAGRWRQARKPEWALRLIQMFFKLNLPTRP